MSALEEALACFGVPEIFNTDQGSQYTSADWIDAFKAASVRISTDGKGRWIDNVFVERLWRTVKYEEVYLHTYRDGVKHSSGLRTTGRFYNSQRLHQSLDYQTPDEVYFDACKPVLAVAV